MNRADLDHVVEIHTKAFHRFFLTRLGPKFLRVYYEAVLSYDEGIAVVAEEGETCFGFAVGFKNPGAFKRKFRRAALRHLGLVAASVLKKPSLIASTLANGLRFMEVAKSDSDSVELSSIASYPQGKGVGSALLSEFEAKAALLAATKITLTTDSLNNYNAMVFYERHAYVMVKFESRGARQLSVYEKKLD